MRFGLISDIHSNLEALQAVIKDCKDQGVREYYCIGDVVGYGANPKECIELVQQLNAVCVAGNHDWAVTGKVDTTYFNPVAKAAVEWTQTILPKQHLDYLNNLDLVFKHKDFMMVHGTLNNPGSFIYLLDLEQSIDTFYLMDRNVCFIGHTHVPQVFQLEGEHICYIGSLRVELKPQNKYVVNIGSIGQPRDGNPLAAYGIYEPNLQRVEIRRIPYDVKTAQKKILEAGLPEFLAHRLAIGQ